jgi:hypothetical protein
MQLILHASIRKPCLNASAFNTANTKTSFPIVSSKNNARVYNPLKRIALGMTKDYYFGKIF